MTRQKVKVVLSLTAVIAAAAVIFFFSAQNGEESSAVSGAVTRFILNLCVPGFDGMTLAQQQPYLETWGRVVRKLAHFSEYALLGAALLNFLRLVLAGRPRGMIGLSAWALAAAYACSDEWHQTFVSDRAGMFQDVGIDSAGALTGVLLAALVLYLARRHRRMKAPTEQAGGEPR